MKFLFVLSILAFVTLALADGWRSGTATATLQSLAKRNNKNDLTPARLLKNGKNKLSPGRFLEEILDTHRTTWYTGQDLKNAACYGRNGRKALDMHDQDMIAAFKGDFALCFKCIEIKGGKGTNKKKIVVKLVDKCAGCYKNEDIDLTKAAFKRLAPLDTGVIEITWRALTKCPKNGRWPK
ncbi:uncharacterized protein VTP21DRAFT_7416 [Calcarisporiella thermophila]|uniref:uncharacterized protein n=1 Tax=Calcarisporiella thermophila TaxID=911321 RepID=UPI0037425A2F